MDLFIIRSIQLIKKFFQEHFIHADPLCMTGQVVWLSSPVQEEVHLKLCVLWPGRVELTCTLDPSLYQQSVVILHFYSFSPTSKEPTHLNSLKKIPWKCMAHKRRPEPKAEGMWNPRLPPGWVSSNSIYFLRLYWPSGDAVCLLQGPATLDHASC